jgi:hypothetical protein
MEVCTIPDDGPSPLEAAAAEVAALKTALLLGDIRLFTDPDYTPSVAATAAAMDARESVFPGYTAGGISIAAVPEEYLSDDYLSYLLTLTSVQWNRSDAGAEVLVHGLYVVDKDGVLRGVFKFPEPRSMVNTLSSIVASVTFRVQ